LTGGDNLRYIVDRIEGKLAVCEQEDGSFINLELANLPDNISDGSVLDYVDGKYTINKQAEKSLRGEVEDLLNYLFT
jgi:hypothetical protein